MQSIKPVMHAGHRCLRWYHKRKPRYRRVVDDKKIEQEIAQLRADLILGGGVPPKPAPPPPEPEPTPPEPTPPTTEDTLPQWHAHLLTTSKPQQANAADYAVRRTLAAAEITDLATATPELLDEVIKTLRCKPKSDGKEPPLLSERSRHWYARKIKQYYAWLLRRGFIAKNPLADWKLKKVKTERNPRDRLQPEELALLITTTLASERTNQGYDGMTRAWIYRLAAYTGLRRGELGAITGDSFDWHDRSITVGAAYTKNGEVACVRIHKDLVDALREWVGDTEDEIFPGLRGKCVARMIKADLREAGIPYRTKRGVRCFHSLRNSFVSALFDAGYSMPTVQRLARHSDISLTAKYAKPLADEARAVDTLPCPLPPKIAAKTAKSPAKSRRKGA